MDTYDPDRAPDPTRWLALDEADRLKLVQTGLRREKHLLNRTLHAAFHVIVENQVAMGDETPVVATPKWLMDEGLSRHDEVHAVGSVLSSFVYRVMKHGDDEPVDDGDANESYWGALDALTAEEWRRSRE